jgi:hypothetical protein
MYPLFSIAVRVASKKVNVETLKAKEFLMVSI